MELESKLKSTFVDIASELELNEKILSCKSNYSVKGDKAGSLIAYEVDINELAYPADSYSTITKSCLVLYIKPHKAFYELFITNNFLQYLQLHSSIIRIGITIRILLRLLSLLSRFLSTLLRLSI